MYRHVNTRHGHDSNKRCNQQYNRPKNINSVWPNYKDSNIYENLSFLEFGRSGSQAMTAVPAMFPFPPPVQYQLPQRPDHLTRPNQPAVFPQPMSYADAMKLNNQVYGQSMVYQMM